MVQMLGWLRDAAAWASRSKRLRASLSRNEVLGEKFLCEEGPLPPLIKSRVLFPRN